MWSTSFVFICLLCSTNPTFGDYYSSLLSVEKLVETEDQFIKTIENYIESTEKLLGQCEKALDIWQKNHDRDVAHPEEFVKLPINEFKLIKRNSLDRDVLIHKFLRPAKFDYHSFMIEIIRQLPDETDLYETSLAIAKLSFVYNITFTSMLIDGELSYGGKRYYHKPLESDEIIVFFQQLYSNKFNVINHLSENQFVYPVMDAMEYISYYHPSERKYQVAVHHFYKLVQFLANEVSPYVLISFVSQVKSMYPDEPIIEEIHSLAVTRLEEVYYQNHTRAQKYQQLCQGKRERSVKLLSTLTCYYLRHSRSLYLLIAPAKVEQLNVDPEILLFHDILTDNQMERIKNAAVPHLKRSRIYGENGSSVSNIRLTHQGKLAPNRNNSVDGAQNFVQDVTGLNKEGFEYFHVNLYGVGGYYLYHTDSLRTEFRKRSATMLFYLSDVQLGGATVFPHFNLTVQARKGTAIFWYNTHTSGEIDNRMMHSACPVLLGHKWIGTYWIRYKYQTFHRPCIPNEYHSSIDHFYEEHVIIPELQQQ
ncbi:hypothetical protein M8J75_002078 [Diaphorina citri]|nr:hypothetical protein M8J75_002078 [Diaphorina citri]